MKLSLAIIAKDERKQLERIVNDYAQFFDEICIAYDYPSAKFEHPKVKWFEYTWCDDFSHKRNFLTKQITGDYYLRLDCDDAIINPEKVRGLAQRAYDKKTTIVYCWYRYSKDEWGNTNAGHYRETIIKKDDNIYWNKPIHENILPKTRQGFRIYIDEKKEVEIDHLVSHEHALDSFERNAKYLIEEYNRDKDKTDPRTVAYLGRTLFSIGQFDEALFFLQKHIEKSGWDEDRYISWCYIAEIMRHKKDYQQAIAAANEALMERPTYPDAYFKLHDIYCEQEKWERAIYWGEEGLKKPIPKTFVLMDPSAYTWRPALSLSFCLLQVGQVEKAMKYFQIAKKAAPTLDFILKTEKTYEEAIYRKKFVDNFIWLFSFIKERDENQAIKLLDLIPKEMHNDEVLINLKQAHLPPRKWDGNEIAIMCGSGGEVWADPSVETGIGGSEAAVIYLSRELAKLGYKVTVYNNCAHLEGEYNGVRYVDWYKFNSADEFNILIAWRMNMFTLADFKAKQKLIWMHDYIREDTFPENMNDVYDKIIMLSQYHTTLLPKHITKDKLFITSNGIVPDDFKVIKGIKREPHRIIYASSYDRGLEFILKRWSKIRQTIPDAEIHIFYGWNTYDIAIKRGYGDQKYKDYMVELMNQEGVFEHGRVGHKELLKEYAKSALMIYPCTYFGEINCIALTKALACGCRVVSNSAYVLGERNLDVIVDGGVEDETVDKMVDKSIEILKRNNGLNVDTEKYINDNSWEKIAKDWHENLMVRSPSEG